MSDTAPQLLRTPLHALHLELGARMVPFAGYEMPVQYPSGLMHEHKHCRASAALFDVSHMGQISLSGQGAAALLETLVPMDVLGLPEGKQRYAFFTNDQGGILDDLMITRRSADWLLIVNAACKGADLAHLQAAVSAWTGEAVQLQALPELALIALQGPTAVQALAQLNPGVAALSFMTGGFFDLLGVRCFLTRSGYTGEDGFEISVPAPSVEALARALLALPGVQPAGLGARDTLRLEAGLCLYGHDIDTHTTPVEAALTWAIQKVRRPGGERAGGYPGAAVIAEQLTHGAARRRVGLMGLERAPVREGSVLTNAQGQEVGRVTSGTLGPSVNQPIAMASIEAAQLASAEGASPTFNAMVRGRALPMRVVPMPFSPHRYHRG